ncbi:hypothetical protein C8C76_15213, partial [Halanaerobium saccharolyticum]
GEGFLHFMRIPILTIMITINIFKKTIRFDVTANRAGG